MNEEDVDLKPKYILKDLSLNGTYYLKGRDIVKYKAKGQEITGKF